MYIIGIDIGGTKCAVTLASCEPDNGSVDILFKQIIDTKKCPADIKSGPTRTIEAIFGIIDTALCQQTLRPIQIKAIGISCGGPLYDGVILSPPNLQGWDNVPIVDMFEKRYGIPTKLENDANACAVAEWKYGAGRGYTNIVFFTFGTGLGAGIILNGKLYSGTNGMAGEAGHIRLSDFGPVGYGKSGSFEGFCSGGGIAQLARQIATEHIQRGNKPAFYRELESEITAKSVAKAAEEGDTIAKQVFEISGDYLGRGLSIVIDILNPEIIIIGSIFLRCEQLLRPAMEHALKRESLSQSRQACKIVSAALGENVGDYAALALALL